MSGDQPGTPGAPLELVTVEGHLPFASNTTLLASDRAGEKWVYKPQQGESPLWDFPWMTLAAREVLTFETAAALELDIVPETVLASGPMGPGSAQRFIAEDLDFDPRRLYTPKLDEQLWPVAVLDLVTNNADRKIGHVIREARSGRLWAIDHGLTFHAHPKLRTVLWGFAGEPLPPDLVEGLRQLRAEVEGGLARRVGSLLSTPEAAAFVERIDGLLRKPVHPEPPTDRPAVPWPLW
jgi:hypothetical protein